MSIHFATSFFLLSFWKLSKRWPKTGTCPAVTFVSRSRYFHEFTRIDTLYLYFPLYLQQFLARRSCLFPMRHFCFLFVSSSVAHASIRCWWESSELFFSLWSICIHLYYLLFLMENHYCLSDLRRAGQWFLLPVAFANRRLRWWVVRF